MAIQLPEPRENVTLDNVFIEKSTKHSETFNYGTCRLTPPLPPGVSALPAFVSEHELKVGFYYTIKGTWVEFNSKPQIKIESIIEERAPKSSDGLKKFFTGYESIGPIKANKIVDSLGENAFEKIVADYKILLPWLREEVALAIKEDLVGDPERQALKRDLMSIGVGNSIINKIFDYLGDNAINTVKEKPYDLIHIEGIGFKTCDSIAIKIGKVDLNDPERLKRIAIYIAEEIIERESGDTLFTLEDIRQNCKKALKNINAFDGSLLMQRVDEMIDESKGFKLIEISKKQYLQTEKSYWDEKSIASRVASAVGTVKKFHFNVDVDGDNVVGSNIDQSNGETEDKGINQQGKENQEIKKETKEEIEKIDLSCIGNRLSMMSADQLAALEGMITQRICVLTGGPGTGKSFVVNSVKTAFKLNNKSVAVVAPTGKAAALVGGTTIHRKLGWGLHGNWGPNTEITDDVLIVDESSMIDNDLFLAMMNMTNKETRVIFVGDPDQLPPIGKGFPFKQIIACGKVPVYNLTTIHRTADGSMIPQLAQQIKNGEKINIDHESVVIITDKKMERRKTEIKDDGNEELETAPLEVLTEKLVNTYISMMLSAKQQGESIGVADMMVLVPYSSSKMKPNTADINRRIQEFRFKNHPDKFIFEKGTKRLAIGDRVIRTKNRLIEVEDGTEDGLFVIFNSNGDCGIITGKTEYGILVKYDRDDIPKDVLVPNDQISEIQLAYALSYWKGQGSQARFVLVAAHSSNGYLVDRACFYTAVTRARELVVIVTPSLEDAHNLYKKKSQERKSLVGFRIKTWKKSMDGASFIGKIKETETNEANAAMELNQVDTQGPRKLLV